jgi:hypothetical protein
MSDVEDLGPVQLVLEGILLSMCSEPGSLLYNLFVFILELLWH